MRILFTNSTLADRSGSELYVRDLAMALRARGHEPIAFSPLLGEVANDLREATIPVTNDLRSIRIPPDVIHGQHHLETMAALVHFPAVPAVFVCHGWLPWQEVPPAHPRIHRYVAVDDTVRDRLVIESGIDSARVHTLYNFVDLDRFARRPPLPDRPKRALILNTRATEENFGAIVREACGERGIEVDLIGYGSGRPVRQPELLFPRYDLVFARARTALEALVVGCAVIVADPMGMAGAVTSRNLDALRRANFGVRALTKPVTAAALGDAIDSFDPADAMRVAASARAAAGMDAVIDVYESLYEAARNERTGGDDREAIADYLCWLSLQTKLPGFSEWNELKKRHDTLALDNAALRSRLADGRELRVAEGELTELERQTRGEIRQLRKRVGRLRRSPLFLLSRMLRRS